MGNSKTALLVALCAAGIVAGVIVFLTGGEPSESAAVEPEPAPLQQHAEEHPVPVPDPDPPAQETETEDTSRRHVSRISIPQIEATEALVQADREARRARELAERSEVEDRPQPTVLAPSSAGSETLARVNMPRPNAETRERALPSRDTIRAVFDDARPEFRECYELLLDLEPDSSDRLIIQMVVDQPDDPDSEFGQASLESIQTDRLQIDDLECFQEVVSGLQLPRPPDDQGAYNLTYPVALASGGRPTADE
ncbi:MAG: hypothetical protein KC561_01235 [Myxococcales bacterium]|nr:hypothetical protein [Myxococcales bacterium]